jgi:hypothetical protein
MSGASPTGGLVEPGKAGGECGTHLPAARRARSQRTVPVSRCVAPSSRDLRGRLRAPLVLAGAHAADLARRSNVGLEPNLGRTLRRLFQYAARRPRDRCQEEVGKWTAHLANHPGKAERSREQPTVRDIVLAGHDCGFSTNSMQSDSVVTAVAGPLANERGWCVMGAGADLGPARVCHGQRGRADACVTA